METKILYNYNDLSAYQARVLSDNNYTNEQRMDIMQQLLEADALELGYSILEMTSDTIPDAQSYNDKRLIALVVDEGNYHFYMQHSDNTWSHKPGNQAPSNKCLECGISLNNSNIQ